MPAQMHDFLTEDIEALVMRLCTSRSELKERMVGSLRGRGATMVQAEETAEEVITECLRVGGENLLTRFHGKCAVDVWMMRVAINRLVSAQRLEAAMRRRICSRARMARRCARGRSARMCFSGRVPRRRGGGRWN